MVKKLTITVSDEVYESLHRRIGRRKISRFIDALAREHLVRQQLAADCAEAAADDEREREAKEWIQTGVDDGLPDEDFSAWPRYPPR
ncbi:MAG: hypothetical protein ACXWVA_02780 [Rhodoplanes sp.]